MTPKVYPLIGAWVRRHYPDLQITDDLLTFRDGCYLKADWGEGGFDALKEMLEDAIAAHASTHSEKAK